MPLYVSASAGQTIVSGSMTTSSGSQGQTDYGATGISSSQGSTLSGSHWPFYAAGTGSYPTPVTGAMQVVSGSGPNCHKLYVYMGTAADGWVFVTGSSGCS